MKSRILIDSKTMCLMKQPDGYDPMTLEFIRQYNAACKISNPQVNRFNKENDPDKLGDEEYERRYFALFMKSFNEVAYPEGIYEVTEYDGENFTYHLR